MTLGTWRPPATRLYGCERARCVGHHIVDDLRHRHDLVDQSHALTREKRQLVDGSLRIWCGDEARGGPTASEPSPPALHTAVARSGAVPTNAIGASAIGCSTP